MSKRYGADVRGILGHRDFTENVQKTLFATFSDAGKITFKKTLKKPAAAPGNLEKPSKNSPAAP